MWRADSTFAGDRHDLLRDGIQVELNLASLLPCEIDMSSDARLSITRLVSLQLKRRGVELRLVLGGEGDSERKADPSLLRALSRGHRWFDELALGRACAHHEDDLLFAVG
jgi:hypothetical protein